MRCFPFLVVIVLVACNNVVQPTIANKIVKQNLTKSPPQKINYDSCKQQIVLLKQHYRATWKNISQKEKEIIFTNAVTETIMPAWMGTKRDFNGITQTPQKGTIACGYFVTTVLRDAGFKLNRSKLAQQPSELIIRQFANKSLIKKICDTDISTFVAGVKKMGYGLYIVGLDCHVGFILNDGQQVYFIHASWVGSRDVQKEIALNSWVLRSSKFKEVGKISADENLLNNWIN